MRFFDSHCHLENWMIDEIKKSDTKLVCNIGCDYKAAFEAVELAKKYDFVYGTVGIHPEYANIAVNVEEAYGSAQAAAYGGYYQEPSVLDDIKELAKKPKIVAIGEIGLDFHWEDNPPKDVQIECFREQIEIAKELGKPICIHSRDADRLTFDILKDSRAFENIKVLMHCYSGSAELAKEYLKEGAWISIAGPVTYKGNKKTAEVVRTVPLERLLIETDSPYLAPEPVRGKPNHPGNVCHTAARIAEILELPLEQVAEATFVNACSFYGINI